MPTPADALESFFSQFVNALEQTPEGQAISQVLCEIAKPSFDAIGDLFHAVEQYTPPSPPTDLRDWLHSAIDYSLLHNSQIGQIVSDGTHEPLNKAFDFHLL